MSFANTPNVTVVIRALNEAEFLPECLSSVLDQDYDGEIEIVLVDSGSTDLTIEIAESYNCKIVHIKKSDFSFGRSLNMGCSAARGDVLVLLSAHCIPNDRFWLKNLVQPIFDGVCDYSYGRQIARLGISKFSEGMVFKKYYPEKSSSPQVGYFCNNANSAIKRKTWDRLRFNEVLTGLEDMELARRLIYAGGSVSYIAESTVEHIHRENWARIKIRYEREAVAMTDIEPNLNLNFWKACKMFFHGVISDVQEIKNTDYSTLREITLYRACQYWGSYVGSSASRKKIERMQDEYFYPKQKNETIIIGDGNENNCLASNEGS
ncbi:glycosyltransferase [Planktomarina temperata]|nr:glycosyltransferase [Planktomarina temperata]